VERVVLNALTMPNAALPPGACAFGDCSAIVFGEDDPPLDIPEKSSRRIAMSNV
jgi:hypothetical protein